MSYVIFSNQKLTPILHEVWKMLHGQTFTGWSLFYKGHRYASFRWHTISWLPQSWSTFFNSDGQPLVLYQSARFSFLPFFISDFSFFENTPADAQHLSNLIHYISRKCYFALGTFNLTWLLAPPSNLYVTSLPDIKHLIKIITRSTLFSDSWHTVL